MGIVKKLLKTTRNKKKKHNKIVMLARSKLNSIESTIYKALIDNEISHEGFTTIIIEKRNCHELKESIRTMKSQRSDIENKKGNTTYAIHNDRYRCILVISNCSLFNMKFM